MRSISLRSPAKLNLYLKVINKRKDGFHNLVTLFERINLCDEIQLTVNPQGKIRIFCDHPHVPLGPQNLAYQAARMLKDDFALRNGVDIKIRKRIPVAAGLAGGSSNAASVLMGLNRLWALSLNNKELIYYAAKIGSDVPFFLHETNWAIGTDRGDRIKKVFLTTKLWHVLVVPRRPVYTAEVFETLAVESRQAPNLKLTKIGSDVNILIRTLKKNDVPKVGRLLSNDLERAMLRLCPNLSYLKDKMRHLNTKGVGFSGSGPAIFGLTESQKEAEVLRSALKKTYSQVFVVSTL